MAFMRDLTGQRFGRLIAMKESGKNKKGGNFYWECQCDCGKIKRVMGNNLTRGHTRSCGCFHLERATEMNTGSNSKVWKGGRRMSHGYVLLLIHEHPNADFHGYVFEHRLVMETHLNRLLTRDETIHHRNGNRADNRIENLELRLNNTHPPGQSIQDLIPYWKNMLKRYAPHELKEE